MGKIKSFIKLIFFDNFVSNLLIITVLCGVMFLSNYFLNMMHSNKIPQVLPDNLIYLQTNEEINTDLEESYSDKFNVKTNSTYPLHHLRSDNEDEFIESPSIPYRSNVFYDLGELDYIKETSTNTVETIQEDIRVGNKIANPEIYYSFNSEYLNNKDVSLYNEFYGIDRIDTGKYPTAINEVLIGEATANYYIKEFKVNTFQDLLGKEISLATPDCDDDVFCIKNNYKISGVYLPSIGFDEGLIIQNNNIDENIFKGRVYGYFLEFDTKKERDNFISETNYVDILTRESLAQISWTKIIKIVLLIVVNILLIILWWKNMFIKYLYLDYYNVNSIAKILVILLPFILVNIFFILILL